MCNTSLVGNFVIGFTSNDCRFHSILLLFFSKFKIFIFFILGGVGCVVGRCIIH